MAQSHPPAGVQHTGHRSGVGTVGPHQLAVIQLHIGQEALVAPHQGAFHQRTKAEHGGGHGGRGWVGWE